MNEIQLYVRAERMYQEMVSYQGKEYVLGGAVVGLADAWVEKQILEPEIMELGHA